MIHYKEVQCGFEYGAAKITRCMSDDKKGWIVLLLKTPKAEIQIYVTKTGKVRLFNHTGEEFKILEKTDD